MPPLTVGQFMTRSPHSIGKGQPLRKAHEIMQEHSIRHLPVLAAGKIVGIVSERDLHVVETFADVDPATVPVEEAMTESPFVTTADTLLAEAVEGMLQNRYGSVVVLSASGHVSGIFTTVDALRVLHGLLVERRD